MIAYLKLKKRKKNDIKTNEEKEKLWNYTSVNNNSLSKVFQFLFYLTNCVCVFVFFLSFSFYFFLYFYNFSFSYTFSHISCSWWSIFYWIFISCNANVLNIFYFIIKLTKKKKEENSFRASNALVSRPAPPLLHSHLLKYDNLLCAYDKCWWQDEHDDVDWENEIKGK